MKKQTPKIILIIASVVAFILLGVWLAKLKGGETPSPVIVEPGPSPTATATPIEIPSPDLVIVTPSKVAKRSLGATANATAATACTPPGGTPGNAVIKHGVVTSWASCYMSVRFDDGTTKNLFAGFGEKDTSPAIGASAMVSYDPTTGQNFWTRFDTVYPFRETTPSPTPPTPSPTATPTPIPTATPTPTPNPTPTPTPLPSPSPTATPTPAPLPVCVRNQVIGNPPKCRCLTQAIGNPKRCK
jgi:hypothetical protein